MALTRASFGWFLIVFLWTLPASAGTQEEARRAYDAGRFYDAMGIWEKLSHEGNAEAAFGLGLLYDLGNGTPQDAEKAFSWYKFAAEAGIAEAEFNVGAMYDGGRGVAADAASSALWFARAAAHGHHRAQYDLGLLYARGDGVPYNPEAAAVWFRAAERGGVSAARIWLRVLKNPPAPRGQALSAAALAAPGQNSSILVMPAKPVVEVVWTAPREAEPVRYQVEVQAPDGHKTSFDTHATALLVHLADDAPHSDGVHYMVRVSTVGAKGARVTSAWRDFTLEAARLSPQTMTNLPQGSDADQ